MYILYLLLVVVLVFVIHSILPTYYNKIFNRSVVKSTGQDNKIMLTFDDGPDERYIHDLLDLLDENGVKATFFMVAENAHKNREIVDKIMAAGHRVGLHSWQHKNAMLYSYSYTRQDFENSARIMRDLGVEELLYRPPWGHTNIFSNHFVRKYGMKMIYWDVMAEDWEAKASPESIRQKLLDRTSPTSIICLHDAGENSGGAKGAPKNTIEGLRLAIPELKDKGYDFILP
ncbi:polysaccharide deacetylase [Peptostreptococcus sp. MV1]|uniref:polysaccharide deacetylase family protein n=1 Tax=Peptostreptococcus sp. MV1 TaxID=1219626 RepID=UPI00050EE984|nr:polysaccharide deacetylase family protein [Peptostreptococcus sp. MV1]KGF10559.1 polysaccharide deacetylase [Peptostreptococcus sp. MV1]